uniref:Uncharacterized protein n=2 Tax=Oryza sativa subsp. japonica TaxID=39947 RepID=Q8H8S7_ORYSJ|nr:hypothetical protein [Oryza sativa Japonica Group]ABF97473.1 hypothetical protein LOC_Os03g40240 [Oryza sativa Japonica Group]
MTPPLRRASVRYFRPLTILRMMPEGYKTPTPLETETDYYTHREQLSTRVGYGRVHSIIENILDKCGVIAPNLPTKTDDLSHSTGHGWTTREKVVNR